MEPADYKHFVPPGLVFMVRNFVRKTRIFGLVPQRLRSSAYRLLLSLSPFPFYPFLLLVHADASLPTAHHSPPVTDYDILCCSLRNLITAKMVSTTKSAIATSCATRNDGSDCVGANALSAGTFWKSCTIKTKTFR